MILEVSDTELAVHAREFPCYTEAVKGVEFTVLYFKGSFLHSAIYYSPLVVE